MSKDVHPLDVPKTVFIDIDGTLFEHLGKGPGPQRSSKPLPGAKEFVDALHARGYHIVVTTGRHSVWDTESALKEHGFEYNNLLVGLPPGERIVINDSKPDRLNVTCRAITKIRNQVGRAHWDRLLHSVCRKSDEVPGQAEGKDHGEIVA